jgi:hypothetical protein
VHLNWPYFKGRGSDVAAGILTAWIELLVFVVDAVVVVMKGVAKKLERVASGHVCRDRTFPWFLSNPNQKIRTLRLLQFSGLGSCMHWEKKFHSGNSPCSPVQRTLF